MHQSSSAYAPFRRLATGCAAALLLLLAGPIHGLEAGAPAVPLAVADIDSIGPARLEALQTLEGLAWWAELDDQLLLAGSAEALSDAAGITDLRVLPPVPAEWRLFVVQASHQRPQAPAGAVELAAAAGRMIVAAPALPSLEPLGDHAAEDACRRPEQRVFALEPDMVLAAQRANHEVVRRTTFEPAVQQVVDSIDVNRWFSDIVTLAGWNRNTRRPGVLDARDWLAQQFSAFPGMSVTTQSFQVGSTTAWNVIADLPGKLRPDTWHIVGAHYDSTSENTAAAAPGAEDNASGCAGVLELARAMVAHPPAETVLFICYSGEEQGLYGSTDHASRLVASGDGAHLASVQIMDMIGYTGDADLDCLLESNSSNIPLMNLYADAAAQYTNLRIVTSTFPFGSDHVPYLNRGFTTLLVIENDWDSYPSYHRTTDLPGNVSLAMGGETLRMNAAALAHLAGAPSAEAVFGSGFESGDLSEWSSSCSDCGGG
ncbi:MAG: M28 family peptidase [Acidobacteria bacterium]|nr:M28 family peptidase [Acidobacteriota bacterium]